MSGVAVGPRRRGRTKVMEPTRWALPPQPITGREVRQRLPEDAGAVTSKPPLLFVHGLGAGAWCWDEHWMPALAAAGWPCYAVSLRGHGASGGAEGIRRWKLRDYEHDVWQTIVDLPSPPVLVGHSMGALVVRRVIARYPARGAVLVAPAGGRNGLGIGVKLARHRPWQLARGTVGLPVQLDAGMRYSPELDGHTARRYAGQLTDDSPLAQYEIFLRSRERTARCPVLVLGGGQDRIVPVSDIVQTARTYGTRARMFAGMGHDLMLDGQWQWPLAVMTEWLERLVDD